MMPVPNHFLLCAFNMHNDAEHSNAPFFEIAGNKTLQPCTSVMVLCFLPQHLPEVLAVLDLLPHVLVDLVHPLQAGQHPRVFLQGTRPQRHITKV